MPQLPDLNHLSHAEKDALIRALWAQVEALTARVAELAAKLGEPAKTSGNSSLPPARDQKANRLESVRKVRQGLQSLRSISRKRGKSMGVGFTLGGRDSG